MHSWQDFIKQQESQAYFQTLMQHIDSRRAQGISVFPPHSEVFSAFELTPLNQVKLVILGQDPYHGPGQAHGLSFSVKQGVKTPPSLVNIYKELAQDIEGFITPAHGELIKWADQGILLLNTVLTVEQGQAHSHAKLGWEQFTDKALELLNEQDRPIVFLLWGSHAIKKGKLITAKHHHVLSGPHPSPLSAYRGFFGCQHFSKANQLLQQADVEPIDWNAINQ
ncbi:uracil-DNA glycosylase [Shewanella sp. WXL01]|uniref:uracil-DNA glycosylase n=1 Tax=Shewanella sp. WXL01 TaxID=2709721 RepID=UPI0014383FF3|nr:uracil-DNA glycosylase [Shewanella sp. WXL01]